jgi:hypothetical protein
VLVSDTGHEILPAPGSARRERDGQPASLLDYPVTATCAMCGELIRCER